MNCVPPDVPTHTDQLVVGALLGLLDDFDEFERVTCVYNKGQAARRRLHAIDPMTDRTTDDEGRRSFIYLREYEGGRLMKEEEGHVDQTHKKAISSS